jgi:hypothetical protein
MRAARPQVVEIIRSLIDRIEVHPGKERGHCEVLIVGALAQIIAFTQQKTTAASSRDGGTSLMVAGARNDGFDARGLETGFGVSLLMERAKHSLVSCQRLQLGL